MRRLELEGQVGHGIVHRIRDRGRRAVDQEEPQDSRVATSQGKVERGLLPRGDGVDVDLVPVEREN